MSDPVSAVRDLLTGIPVKVRRTVYGLVGLVILIDGIWDFLPASIDDKVVTTFGVLGSVLALANSADKPSLPPPVPPAYPGEFA